MKLQCILLVLLFLSVPGCASRRSSEAKAIEHQAKISTEFHEQNKQIALAMGTRKFDFPPNLVLKAIVTAMSSNNLSVINLEKDLGFIIAEGPSLLSQEEELKICKEKTLPKVRKGAPRGWRSRCEGTGGKIRITGTVDSKDNKVSTITVGITTVSTGELHDVQGRLIATSNDIDPEITQRNYEIFWQAIDKALFIQKNTE